MWKWLSDSKESKNTIDCIIRRLWNVQLANRFSRINTHRENIYCIHRVYTKAIHCPIKEADEKYIITEFSFRSFQFNKSYSRILWRIHVKEKILELHDRPENQVKIQETFFFSICWSQMKSVESMMKNQIKPRK